MKNKKSLESPIVFIKFCLIALLVVVILRLCSMGAYPLFDTTEARYAGIALEMVKSGDWITPSMPISHKAFLAKPVLSFWLNALSFKAFGINEFAVRLPNFIETLLILLFTYLIGRKFYNKAISLLAPCILFTASFVFIQAASVDLDVMVCLVNTASFWAYLCIMQAFKENNKKKKLIYELVLGFLFSLSLLNKGLIGLVLFGGAIFLYALWERNSLLIFRVNWFLVVFVGLILAAPWYYLAELHNPGFIKYFILNEHFYRYLKKDCGDRYGNPHVKPYGTSWVFTLGAFMPWSPLILPVVNEFFTEKKYNKAKIFLLSCAIFPPMFFMLGCAILMNYILASLPPLAILVSRVAMKSFNSPQYYIQKINNTKNIFVRIWNFLANPIYTSCPALIISTLIMFIIFNFYYLRYYFGLHSTAGKTKVLLLIVFVSIIITSLFIFIFYKFLNKMNLKKFVAISFLISMLTNCIFLTVWFLFFTKPLADQKSMKSFVQRLRTEIPNFSDYSINTQKEQLPASWFYYSSKDYYKMPIEETEEEMAGNITFVEQSHLDKYCEANPQRCKDKFAFKEHKYFVFKY